MPTTPEPGAPHRTLVQLPHLNREELHELHEAILTRISKLMEMRDALSAAPKAADHERSLRILGSLDTAVMEAKYSLE